MKGWNLPIFRSLNPRQEKVSWHRLGPHGRRKFCFRGSGTRNIKGSRGTAAGRQNSDDVAKYTGNMKWRIALLHIWFFCRSLVSNSCILTTCSECSVSIKWQLKTFVSRITGVEPTSSRVQLTTNTENDLTKETPISNIRGQIKQH
jgi:hypothetical protein